MKRHSIFDFSFTAALLFGFACFAATNPVLAMTISDIPVEDRPYWYDDIDPDLIAFAFYDYTSIEGLEGEYTNLEKGPQSLFDETASGISELTGDWAWVDGQGWTTNGSSITFHWKNVRVPTNRKFFAQSVTFGGGTVTGIEVTTDAITDVITRPGFVINGDRLIINATITPQPDDVWVKVNFAVQSPLIVEKGWVLDQCCAIPEPPMLLLLTAGAVGFLSLRVAKSRNRELV